MSLDESLRRDAIRTLQAAVRIARELGARGIDTDSGSVNPDSP